MPDWLQAKVAPMLAVSSAPFDSDRHLFEVKWDGIRALAFFGEGRPRLQGRKLTEATDRYPEIVAALEKLDGNGILDGEIVVLDDEGRPNFQRVLVREQTATREAALLKASKHPVAYMVFDLLYRNGQPLFERPLLERKQLLSELLAEADSPLVESAYFADRGLGLFEQAKAYGLEGVVAKLMDSRYRPGERSNDWLKLKVRRTIHGVLVGLVRERGAGRVKSLVLGAYRNGTLEWIGNVGSGLDQKTLRQLGSELSTLKSGPPQKFGAVAPGEIEWLRPSLVVRAEYAELTNEGRLRHPTFVGFVSKLPEECLAP